MNPRAIATALFLAGLIAAGNCIAESPATNDQLADAALVKLVEQGFSGSVLVARDGNVIYARDSGFDREPDTPPSYWIASITKQFVAAGILLLQERGSLSIGDPVGLYLADVPEDKRDITVFHLLVHTSGLRQNYAADGITDKAEARRALLGPELQARPGEKFAYANDNYNLLAIILEEVSGETYEEFLQTQIFDPAGMTSAGSWGIPIPDNVFLPPVVSPLDGDAMAANWGFRGATGMRASVPDLFSYLQSLHDNELLSAASVDLLMGNHAQSSGGTDIGFNWFGRRSDDGVYMQFSRGQESFGGNAVIYIYPEKRLIIITATNAGPAETGDGPITGWSRLAHQVLADIYVNDGVGTHRQPAD